MISDLSELAKVYPKAAIVLAREEAEQCKILNKFLAEHEAGLDGRPIKITPLLRVTHE